MSSRYDGRGEWCALRTHSKKCMRLVESLNSDGITSWTPLETQKRLVRRGPAMDLRDVTSPILPSLVFAETRHLQELLAIVHGPALRHPAFSLVQIGSSIALISDQEISVLRELEAGLEASRQAAIEEARLAEAEVARKAERAAMLRTEQARRKMLRSVRRDFRTGAQVSVKGQHAFAGMSGEVVQANGTSALVFFGGSLTIKIEAWQLIDDAVDTRVKDAA